MVKIIGQNENDSAQKTADQNIITENTPFAFSEAKKRVGSISMNYLRNSSMILDSKGNPLRTRPVQSWELLDDFKEALQENEINFIPDRIYVDRNSSTKRMTRDERQKYSEGDAPIKYWVFNDLITRFVFPDHGDDGNKGCVAVAFNSNGIQVSFGLHVNICSNLDILSGNILQTYGQKKMSYGDILGEVKSWFSTIEQKVKVEMDIMNMLQDYSVWNVGSQKSYEEVENSIIGKVYRDAVIQNYGDSKDVAAINQHNASRFCQELIKQGDNYQEKGEFTAWDLYNVGTSIIRPGNLDTKNVMDNLYLWLITLNRMYEIGLTIPERKE